MADRRLEREEQDVAPEVEHAAESAEPVLAAPDLWAYRLVGAAPLELAPAAAGREWMDRLNRWPYRCLPMVIANQSGWFILNQQAFFVRWDGSDSPEGISFIFPKGKPPYPVESHFGHGILTWKIPFLFRTPPGYNLLVRGPANYPRDGIYALEGIVETDWAAQTFTMNWKFTRPNTTVSFSVGEPICMIVPQRRGELESFQPQVADLDANPALAQQYEAFARGRRDALARQPWQAMEAGASPSWQKHYYRGQTAGCDAGTDEHQTKLKLRPFDGLGTSE